MQARGSTGQRLQLHALALSRLALLEHHSFHSSGFSTVTTQVGGSGGMRSSEHGIYQLCDPGKVNCLLCAYVSLTV